MKKTKTLIFLILTIGFVQSCKKSNSRLTSIAINMYDVETEAPISGVSFEVRGRKSSKTEYTATKESFHIAETIENGTYEGSFYAQRSRWHYYLLFADDDMDDYYFIDKTVSDFQIEKFEHNNFDFPVAKKYTITFKLNNLDCYDIADKITLLMRHKSYDASNKLDLENDEWGTAPGIHGCGEHELVLRYPAGDYQLGVQIRKNEVESWEYYDLTIEPNDTNEFYIEY
ncbi:MAG: hypothetical protein MI810_10715 [Flavobacteriales bacterium]|nr:hypothetical protein [Flavobacteriales bacterium]